MKNKITKEQFFKLKDQNITRSEYNDILSSIDDRFDHIIRKHSIQFFWWGYDDSDSGGSFNPDGYDENSKIEFCGSFNFPDPYYSNQIPIRWLWEDYEEEFENTIAEFERKKKLKSEKAKENRQQLKIKKAEMKKIISEKLTKEELKYIKFK